MYERSPMHMYVCPYIYIYGLWFFSRKRPRKWVWDETSSHWQGAVCLKACTVKQLVRIYWRYCDENNDELPLRVCLMKWRRFLSFRICIQILRESKRVRVLKRYSISKNFRFGYWVWNWKRYIIQMKVR